MQECRTGMHVIRWLLHLATVETQRLAMLSIRPTAAIQFGVRFVGSTLVTFASVPVPK